MPITKAKRHAIFSPENQPAMIAKAIDHLKIARWHLRRAGSKKAADAVARALKSAEGARNHARRMATWQEHFPAARLLGRPTLRVKLPPEEWRNIILK